MCVCKLFNISENDIHIQGDDRPSKISYRFIINRKVNGNLFYEFMNNPIVKNEYKKYNIDDNVYHETNQKIRCSYSPKPAYKTYPKTRGLCMLNETDDIKNISYKLLKKKYHNYKHLIG